jgi:ring-1,2-phenylacetyl-CoA epoxidase subunit PaaE
MSIFHSLTVSAIDRLTDKSVVVSLKVPENLTASFVFEAGQYIGLEATIDKVVVRRSYSICSSPQSGNLQVGIKEVPAGVFSTYVNQILLVGDKFKVGVPEGRFTIKESRQAEAFVGIAAGSGITPIISLVKSVLLNDQDTSFVLLYGNKSPEETMFYDELLSLEKKYPDRFKINWVFSQSNLENSHFGRIDPSIINYLFHQIEKPSKASFYLCGPEAMINMSSKELLEKGVSKENLFFELFSSNANKAKVTEATKKGLLYLTCDEVTHTLELIPGKTLLDIALQAKLDVPYSCQGGVCSTCIAKVTQGKAGMESNQVLTDEEVEEGLVLSCQAIAQTEHISLNYDDV